MTSNSDSPIEPGGTDSGTGGDVPKSSLGLFSHLSTMMFMLFFSRAISDFINERPTLKVLALSFLILIGFVLVAEAFHIAIPKGYIYFAMAFSVGVEMVNIKMLARAKTKVALRQPYR